jgi:hypothetical protein
VPFEFGPVLLELPSFVRDVAATTKGTVHRSAGLVTMAPTVHSVTVTPGGRQPA